MQTETERDGADPREDFRHIRPENSSIPFISPKKAMQIDDSSAPCAHIQFF